MDLPKTNDEVLVALGAKARETNTDSFRVRVQRLGGPGGGFIENLGLFTDAQLAHLVAAEGWLPQLFGGGGFQLICYHQSMIEVPLGYLKFVFKGQQQGLDRALLEDPSWTGPKGFEGASKKAQPSEVYAGDETPPLGTRQRVIEVQPGRGNDAVVLQMLAQMKEDSIRAEQRVEKIMDRMNQRPAEKSLVEQMVPLVTALAPILAAFRDSSEKREARQEALLMEQRREAREQADRQMAQMQAMIEKISTPKGLDPIMQSLLDDAKAQRAELRKLQEKMLESSSPNEVEQAMQTMGVIQQMFGFTMKAIGVAAENRLPKEDTGMKEIIQNALSAAQAFMQSRTPGGAPPGQKALPAGQGQPSGQPSQVDQLLGAIVNHAPVNRVVDTILALAEHDEPSFVQAVKEASGDFNQAALNRLTAFDGGKWISDPNNQLYLAKIQQEIEKRIAEVEAEEAAAEAQAKPVASPPEVTKFEKPANGEGTKPTKKTRERPAEVKAEIPAKPAAVNP